MKAESPPASPPVGQLFSRVYVDRGAPTPDSPLFRNRLEAYLRSNHRDVLDELALYLKQEGGLIIPWSGNWYIYGDFFTKAPIAHVLNAITLIWRYLSRYPTISLSGNPGGKQKPVTKSEAWHQFVARAFCEEYLGYRLDKHCGVHFFVDEEFEKNRVSALSCLDAPRFAGVRAAFDAAHSYLDQHPADTKASVRSAFEALEVLARLMVPESKNLNKWMVRNELKQLALASAVDKIEQDTLSKLFDGLGDFVDGLHNYRHGQGLEQPVAPSLTLAVYVVSTVAAALRVLATIAESRA